MLTAKVSHAKVIIIGYMDRYAHGTMLQHKRFGFEKGIPPLMLSNNVTARVVRTQRGFGRITCEVFRQSMARVLTKVIKKHIPMRCGKCAFDHRFAEEGHGVVNLVRDRTEVDVSVRADVVHMIVGAQDRKGPVGLVTAIKFSAKYSSKTKTRVEGNACKGLRFEEEEAGVLMPSKHERAVWN
jgi:hypothetical protein